MNVLRWARVVVAAGLLATVAGMVQGREDAWGEDERPLETTIGADRYLAGGRVGIETPVAGDAIAAGGSVTLASEVEGDAVLGGGTLDVRGRIGEDLYAAGGSVRVDAIVAEAARIAGGNVVVGRQARFGGGSAVAGGDVHFDGAAGSVLYLAGGRVRFDGEAAADVVVAAREVEVGPRARIAGRLVVRSPSPPQVAEGARIAGGVEHVVLAAPEPAPGAVRVVGGALFAAWIVGLALLALLLLGLLPRFLRQTGAVLAARPLASTGLGFALVVGVPVAAVLLMVTVIGIPVGLLALAAYFPLLLLGYLAAVIAVGDAVLARVRPGAGGLRARATASLAALLVLALAARIPFVGPWIGFVLLLGGLGALGLSVARSRSGTPLPG